MQKIILNGIKAKNLKSVVTIGNFDGVHLGHQKLFKVMNDVALNNNYKQVVLMFEPLPLEYFSWLKQTAIPARLSFLRDKIDIIKDITTIDEVIVLHFNHSIAKLTPAAFIDFLKNRLNACHVVVGHDFRFGHKASGGVAELKTSGLNVTQVEALVDNGIIISSSFIRQLAKRNDLVAIKYYMGRNIRYSSRIIYGNQIGRKYNVPTINLDLGHKKPVLHGIYIARVHIEGVSYNAVASIGKNPTISNAKRYNLEAHLLDVSINLYGKIATVEILKFMRSEAKFINLAILFQQIHQDIQEAKFYFKHNDLTKT